MNKPLLPPPQAELGPRAGQAPHPPGRGLFPLGQNTGAQKSSRYRSYRRSRSEQTTLENGLNMKDWLGGLLMAPFIIGPIVELGLGLSDGAWHQNAFWIFVLSAMGWLWVWWVVKSGLWPAMDKQGF